MTNYQHGWKAVDPEEGKKYRVTFPEKHKADAGSIISWKIYTVKSIMHHQVYDFTSNMFRNTDKIESVIFEEHPLTLYNYEAFTFYPVLEGLPK